MKKNYGAGPLLLAAIPGLVTSIPMILITLLVAIPLLVIGWKVYSSISAVGSTMLTVIVIGMTFLAIYMYSKKKKGPY